MRTFALGLMPHMSLNQLYLTVEALSPIVFDDENVILADLTPQSRRDIKDTLSSILVRSFFNQISHSHIIILFRGFDVWIRFT